MKVSLNDLSRTERKMALEVKEYIGKSHLRNSGMGTQAKHAQNVRTISKELVKMGVQKITHLSQRITERLMERLETKGLSARSLQSVYTTMRIIAGTIKGKEKMLEKSPEKQFGHHKFSPTTEERFNPQRWTSPERRMEQQARLEQINPQYASAADMARHFGLRKAETLSSRELVMKTPDGKLLTTAGSHKAGEYRELKGPRSAQYAFTNNKKNESFEKNYLNKMVPGKEYLYVNDWAKGGRVRLVPVTTQEARDAAIRHQTFIRENIKAAQEMERKGELKDVKVNSVIDPRMNKEEGLRHYGRALTRAGFEKEESKSLHTDRCEFSIRMRDVYKGEDGKGYSREARALALGHCDTRKLAFYES